MNFWHADRHLIENGRSDKGVCHGIPWFVPYLGDMLPSIIILLSMFYWFVTTSLTNASLPSVGQESSLTVHGWLSPNSIHSIDMKRSSCGTFPLCMKTVVQHTHCKIFHRIGQHGQTIRYYPQIASNRYISYKAPIETSFQMWFKSCPP